MAGRAEHLLGPEARARVAAAIARAEAGTSGEIVVMLSARSGVYRSAAPLAALAGEGAGLAPKDVGDPDGHLVARIVQPLHLLDVAEDDYLGRPGEGGQVERVDLGGGGRGNQEGQAQDGQEEAHGTGPRGR